MTNSWTFLVLPVQIVLYSVSPGCFPQLTPRSILLLLLLLTCLPAGSGRLPPIMHRQAAPEGRGQRAAASGFSRAHNTEAIARAKGAGTGAGTGGKSNLAGQIIPVYGFGILVYILYILFKVKHWIKVF